MHLNYIGVNPICQEIKDANPDFEGLYDQSCCRFPKSCSPSMYEFYPEDDIEAPKRVQILRTKGVGPGTIFDWMIIGYHPTAKNTVTLLMYFPALELATLFISKITNWRDILLIRGVSKDGNN